MNSFHRVVKYCAMAFALFLCVNIIGGIVMGLTGIAYLFSGKDTDVVGEMQEYAIEGEISSLSVNLSGAELKIKTSDYFSVKSNHEYISVSSDDGKLIINETKKPFVAHPKGVTVIIYIPEGFVFDEASIDTGAGEVGISALAADVLHLSLGAGEVTIDSLTANTRADINGGAGEMTVKGGKLCNLKLDMGVGELTMKSRIEGESNIDMGVGEMNLTLLGNKDDYCIKVDKGIGEISVDGEDMSDGSVWGSGDNVIDVDGGIGQIKIKILAD